MFTALAYIARAFVLAASTFAVICAVPAFAGVNRAFVAATGANAAGCGGATAPCKTLQYVHDSIINSGGEIVVMGSGEYGPLTITKALAVVNSGGGVASLTQSLAGHNAIWIKARAGDVVLLRGLTMEGAGAAASGIYYQSGASLTVENCVIRRFKNTGLYAAPVGSAKMLMNDTLLADNGGGAVIAPTRSFSGAVSGMRMINNGNGLEITGRNAAPGTPIYLIAADSLASGNAMGFLSTSIAGKAIPTLALDRVSASGNGYGVTVNRGNARLSNSTIAGNGYGVSISSGVVFSTRTNSVVDNGSKVVGGALTVVAPD